MEIVPFEPALDAAAAQLVARRVGAARQANPLLPEAWAEPDAYRPELEALHRRGSGVAVTNAGRLIGFMAAFHIGRGPRWTYTPEWGWAAEPIRSAGLGRRTVTEELYASAAAGWVAAGFRTHHLSVLAGDRTALRTMAWLGFGHEVMDGVRDLAPVRRISGADVRRATRADAAVLAELEDGLRAHLGSSPVFFALRPARSLAEQRRRIADDEAAVLLAEVGGRVVGHLLVGPAADDAATIIRDAATASISGAFVRPDHRRAGVADSLLAAAVEWARRRGFERIAVDFETSNLLATRFWTRSFRPVTFSLVRRV